MDPSPIAACPLCRTALFLAEREVWCANGHHYDRAREGYVNLLRPGKIRKLVSGDDREMVADRRSFLDCGHYRVLAEGLAGLIGELAPATLLDVGCGEGTFTRVMTASGRASMAVDLSRPAVRLAARRCPDALCAVASVHDLPVLDHSADAVVSVMSPTHQAEFLRVLSPDGRVLVVTPGASHLDALRATLYTDYRPHDEEVPLSDVLMTERTERFVDHIVLRSREEIRQVWGMTPYRWNAPAGGVARLDQLDELALTVHFVATVMRAG